MDTNGKYLIITASIIAVLAIIIIICYSKYSTETTIVSPGKLSAVSTNVPIDDSQNIDSDSPYKLYYFYTPSCINCTKFDPTWEKIKEQLTNVPDLSLIKINAQNMDNEKVIAYYGVVSVPTIIYVTPEAVKEYEGVREVNQIISFIDIR